jgi:hypothetical protein
MSEVSLHADDATRVAELSAGQMVKSGRYALDVTLGVQRVLLDEMAKSSNEVMERLRAEIEIASEFVARLASAHSIREIATACADCSEHQAEAFRLDSQMLFRHSQRICEQAAKLFAAGQPPVN